MKHFDLRSRQGDATSRTVLEPTAEQPRSAEVMFEIGLTLALHLAVALAVVLTLRACGIA